MRAVSGDHWPAKIRIRCAAEKLRVNIEENIVVLPGKAAIIRMRRLLVIERRLEPEFVLEEPLLDRGVVRFEARVAFAVRSIELVMIEIEDRGIGDRQPAIKIFCRI